MSADNGVYILATRGRKRKGRGREYRVAHVQAIENAWFDPDYPASRPRLNRELVLELFGKSKVFTDLKIARGYAERILEEVVYAEYGIRVLWYTDLPFPT